MEGVRSGDTEGFGVGGGEKVQFWGGKEAMGPRQERREMSSRRFIFSGLKPRLDGNSYPRCEKMNVVCKCGEELFV